MVVNTLIFVCIYLILGILYAKFNDKCFETYITEEELEHRNLTYLMSVLLWPLWVVSLLIIFLVLLIAENDEDN